MQAPPDHPREEERLQAVRLLGLYGREPLAELHDLTAALAWTMSSPVAVVDLIEKDNIWLLSSHGLDVKEVSRKESICGHTILQDDVVVIADTRQDDRFIDNPFLNGTPPIRAYAGVPIHSSDGLPLGVVCVVDHMPRHYSQDQIEQLRRFAGIIRRELLSRIALVRSEKLLQAREQSLRVSERRFRTFFEKSGIGIALVGAQGRWLQVNEALCTMVGYCAEELLQLSFQDITFPDDLDADLALVQQMLAGEIDQYQLEKRYVHKDGSRLWISLTVTIEREGEDAPYFITMIENIQARKDAENSLRGLRLDLERKVAERTESLRRVHEQIVSIMTASLENEKLIRVREQELRMVLDGAADAYIAVDKAGVICDWNRKAERLFGWPRSEAVGRRLEETIIPSRDREAHKAGMAQYAQTGATHIIGRRLEMMAIDRLGRKIPVEVSIQAFEANGHTRITAFVHDISERRQVQDALRSEREKLQMIANNIPSLVMYLDAQLRCQFINRAYQEMLGTDPQQLIGVPADAIFDEACHEELHQQLKKSLDGQTVSWEHDRLLKGRSGYMMCRFVPDIRDQKIVGLYGLIIDITDRRQREQSSEREATVDELTGLLNRRGLFDALKRLILSSRGEQAVGILLLDINDFKKINDSLGHAAGDEVLRELGRRLALIPGSLSARLGGDEFVLLFESPQGEKPTLAAEAALVHQQFLAPFPTSSKKVQVSVSMGRCVRTPHAGIPPEHLLEGADAAMYRQKRLHQGLAVPLFALSPCDEQSCGHACGQDCDALPAQDRRPSTDAGHPQASRRSLLRTTR